MRTNLVFSMLYATSRNPLKYRHSNLLTCRHSRESGNPLLQFITSKVTRRIFFIICSSTSLNVIADPSVHEHGGQTFHAFQFTMGAGVDDNSDNPLVWEFDGWIGSDNHKLWLKSEGEQVDNKMETAEFSAFYSRNISTFWDAQIGIRYDTQPDALGYLAFGFEGLAPYFFETSAYLFLSEEGDVSARVHVENEWLFTQRLILEPFLEANLYAQDVPTQERGAGLATAEFGLQLRYEMTRKFAPYIEINYERAFGDTAAIHENNGESRDVLSGILGVSVLF